LQSNDNTKKERYSWIEEEIINFLETVMNILVAHFKLEDEKLSNPSVSLKRKIFLKYLE